jgi:hypothetical protein
VHKAEVSAEIGVEYQNVPTYAQLTVEEQEQIKRMSLAVPVDRGLVRKAADNSARAWGELIQLDLADRLTSTGGYGSCVHLELLDVSVNKLCNCFVECQFFITHRK